MQTSAKIIQTKIEIKFPRYGGFLLRDFKVKTLFLQKSSLESITMFNTSSTFPRVESKSAAVCLADKTFEMLEIIRIACGLQLLSLKRCFNKMLSILMHHIYFFDNCCPVSG